jgi:predicted nucleic acid-binding protein
MRPWTTSAGGALRARWLDTNILVRAAADEQGLAGRLLLEIASGPHVLVSSPYVLSEVMRVLACFQVRAVVSACDRAL